MGLSKKSNFQIRGTKKMDLITIQLLIIVSGLLSNILYVIVQKKIIQKSSTLAQHRERFEALINKENKTLNEQLDTIRAKQTIDDEKWKDKKFIALFLAGIIIFLSLGFLAGKYDVFWQYIVIVLVSSFISSKVIK